MSLLAISYPELATKDFDWIQSLRSTYCRSDYEIVDPHFTLLFAASEFSQDQLADHIRPIINETPSIDFVLRCAIPVKTDADNRWYLFLTPDEGFSRIVKLHDRLYTGMMKEHLRLDIPYIPHMTVGIFDEGRACKTAVDRINSEEFAISGRIDAVDLVADEKNKINSLTRIKLGHPAKD